MTNVKISLELNLPDTEVLKTEVSKTNDIIITVKSTKSSTTCRQCGKEATKVHGYAETIMLRHLPILGQQTYIRIKLARYKCEYCDDHPTTTEQLEWFNRRSKFTKAYEEHLMLMLINSTIVDVAVKEKAAYDAVEGTLNRQIATGVDWKKFTQLGTLGIDEIALRKGHKSFVTVISTRISGKIRVIAILPDRKKVTVKSFIEEIPEHLKLTITAVCSDMYDGFINSVKEVLGDRVKVIVDRFHVVKAYRQGVDSLRKKELGRLKKELTDIEYKKLKGAMWAIRKQEQDLREEEKIVLKNLFSYSPGLKKAHALQKELTDIFNIKYNKNTASKRIKKWARKARKSGLSCFDKFLITLRNYWDEILNYFHKKRKKNSGFVEGLNNKIKTIKRRCYGLLSVQSLFQRIYLDLEGYQVFV